MRTFKLTIAFALAGLTGCSPSSSDVAGKVTFDGKPVVFGTVALIDASGVPKYGKIETDGTFRVAGVRHGNCRVAVSSPRPAGMKDTGPKVKKTGRDAGMDERRPADANAPVDPVIEAGWFPLPEKLGDPATSEITHEVKADAVLVLELKSEKN